MRVLAGSCTQNSTPFHIFSFFMKTHTRGADYVTPADVRRIFHCTVAHRLLPAPQTRDVDALLDDLMRSISAPQLK